MNCAVAGASHASRHPHDRKWPPPCGSLFASFCRSWQCVRSRSTRYSHARTLVCCWPWRLPQCSSWRRRGLRRRAGGSSHPRSACVSIARSRVAGHPHQFFPAGGDTVHTRSRRCACNRAARQRLRLDRLHTFGARRPPSRARDATAGCACGNPAVARASTASTQRHRLAADRCRDCRGQWHRVGCTAPAAQMAPIPKCARVGEASADSAHCFLSDRRFLFGASLCSLFIMALSMTAFWLIAAAAGVAPISQPLALRHSAARLRAAHQRRRLGFT